MFLTLKDEYISAELLTRADALKPKVRETFNEIANKECLGSEWLGWYQWPSERGFSLIADIKKQISSVDIFFDTVVVLGIGGSYAGTKAVSEALSHQFFCQEKSTHSKPDRKIPIVFGGHNLSETSLLELLDFLADKQPIVNVISKSGKTIETALAFRVLENYLQKRFGHESAVKRIIAITDQEKGALKQISQQTSYKTFAIPHDVGGRFSVLSSVGMVPLSFGGYDTESIMSGAHQFFQELTNSLTTEEVSHPVFHHACLRHACVENDQRIEVLAYSEPKLSSFVEWWKQLFGESEGKAGKGLFPAGALYSTDLHSLGQYMQEGTPQVLETFLSIENQSYIDEHQIERRMRIPSRRDALDGLDYMDNHYLAEVNHAAMNAAIKAHSERGLPCLWLEVKKLDEFTLGYLFAYFQTLCAVSALMLEVNPFDQPGVEAYKKHMLSLLHQPLV